MRIAIATEVFVPKVDGITNRLRHTIRELRELGHEVLVLAPDAPMRDYAGAEVVSITALPFSPYPGLALGLPEPRILSALRRFQPDVVHLVGPVVLGTWVALAARALALPIVASYHTDLPAYASRYGLGWLAPAIWPLLTAVHGQAHLNLCPSRATRDQLRAHGIDCRGLWRGGVDTAHFHPSKRSLAMRARLTDGHPERPIILYAGRVSPEKNLDTLRLALEAAPGAQLAVVGDGPARASLERSLGSLDATFTGFLHGDELAAAFASSDVFLFPSTTETLGFVALEAMAAGLPVVAADAGGIPELVLHGERGWLYDPLRPLDGARAVARLLESDGLRRTLAMHARKFAEECTWERETTALLDQYRRAATMARITGVSAKLHRWALRKVGVAA